MGGNAIPDLFYNPIFFIEDNGLPTDGMMKKTVADFEANCVTDAQTIYYAKRADFKAYNAFRCIGKRSNLNKPNLEGFCSDSFCLENL